jgi:hypothetical protein
MAPSALGALPGSSLAFSFGGAGDHKWANPVRRTGDAHHRLTADA